MSATVIDTEITNYLPLLNKEQKEAILMVMKTFVHETFHNEYDDEFKLELNNRFTAYENGEIQGFTLKESETRAREIYQAKKK